MKWCTHVQIGHILGLLGKVSPLAVRTRQRTGQVMMTGRRRRRQVVLIGSAATPATTGRTTSATATTAPAQAHRSRTGRVVVAAAGTATASSTAAPYYTVDVRKAEAKFALRTGRLLARVRYQIGH